VRYGLILRMLYSAKRHDLETEAMWAVKVSWSSIMTPRFLAVFYLSLKISSLNCLASYDEYPPVWLEGPSVPFWPGSAEGGDFSSMWIYQRDSPRSDTRSEEHTSD